MLSLLMMMLLLLKGRKISDNQDYFVELFVYLYQGIV